MNQPNLVFNAMSKEDSAGDCEKEHCKLLDAVAIVRVEVVAHLLRVVLLVRSANWEMVRAVTQYLP